MESKDEGRVVKIGRSSGFTVVEMTIAVAIVSVVVGSLGSTVIGIQRMVSRSYAEAELSVRLRGLREKILFHSEPTRNGRSYAGVLSAAPRSTSAVEGGIKLNLVASSVSHDGGQCAEQTIELVKTEVADTGRAYFKNDGAVDPWRSAWLRLANLGTGQTETASLGYLGQNALVGDLLSGADARDIYFVNLTADLGGFVVRQRLAVPVFGREQIKNENSVFHDNLLP